jgi:hypothetical protein
MNHEEDLLLSFYKIFFPSFLSFFSFLLFPSFLLSFLRFFLYSLPPCLFFFFLLFVYKPLQKNLPSAIVTALKLCSILTFKRSCPFFHYCIIVFFLFSSASFLPILSRRFFLKNLTSLLFTSGKNFCTK